jgi:hypothetical protein
MTKSKPLAKRLETAVAALTDRAALISDLLANMHREPGCLQLPPFEVPRNLEDFDRLVPAVHDTLFDRNARTAPYWMDAASSCSHLSPDAFNAAFWLCYRWYQLVSAAQVSVGPLHHEEDFSHWVELFDFALERHEANFPRPGKPAVVAREVLVTDANLGEPRPLFPALMVDYRHKWTPSFRPEILAQVHDAHAGRLGSAERTTLTYRHTPDNDHGFVVDLLHPDGEIMTVNTASEVRYASPEHSVVGRSKWALVDDKPIPLSTDTCLAILSLNGTAIEDYVDARSDVEDLDPDTWVQVKARWIVPARVGVLIVQTGDVALYEPTVGENDVPTDLGEGEEWWPQCRYCGEPLFDPGSIPGMLYPHADAPEPWCKENPRKDRLRPHAAMWCRVKL